jgi:hypothetical protein
MLSSTRPTILAVLVLATRAPPPGAEPAAARREGRRRRDKPVIGADLDHPARSDQD